MDCSYCYLQTYSNSPGLILTANVEDYFPHIEELNARIKNKIRIGTGEFTDSLYLDKHTKYSSYLIPFFKKMNNLVLEMKTKTVNIDNILEIEPHPNCVISWSLNTRKMAEEYEAGSASIDDRIKAAISITEKGYKIGFHFDPIIYYDGWEKEYEKIVEEIFSYRQIRENVEWISLGTLRYTPGLKQVAEQRFSDNRLYYWGDFYTGVDGKLRYPPRMRIKMYNYMVEWIRKFNDRCWVYLCMEPEQIWRKTVLSEKDYRRCNGF